MKRRNSEMVTTVLSCEKPFLSKVAYTAFIQYPCNIMRIKYSIHVSTWRNENKDELLFSFLPPYNFYNKHWEKRVSRVSILKSPLKWTSYISNIDAQKNCSVNVFDEFQKFLVTYLWTLFDNITVFNAVRQRIMYARNRTFFSVWR